jgi:lipopolysaccharide/colanic/teichoic acid biosynthesis glycosyltransferase
VYRKYVKRAVDIGVAALGLVLLLPVLLLVALVVRILVGSPVTYRQERPGHMGSLFTLIKFRTMTEDRDFEGNLLPDADRMPKAGRLLRTTSLDELPELWNVLRGNMSLVGPRPLLSDYLPLYSDHQARRHEVRPGITGWAQVNGRNAVTWQERFDMDVWYVDHVSLSLDTRIMWKTVVAVLSRKGITDATSASMTRFEG